MHVTPILNALKQNGFLVRIHTPLPNGHGEKFVLSNSAVLTFYPTRSNWLIQGKPSPQDEAKLKALMQQLYPKPLAEDFERQAAANPLRHRRIQRAIGTRNEKDVLFNRERDDGWNQGQQQGRSTDQPQEKAMRFDIDAICQRIIEVGMHKANLPEAVAQQVAFHVTDWLRDLSEFHDFCSGPECWSDEKLNSLLLAFLCHVPNHLAAAAKLYADLPVTDVFDVGAIAESGTTP
jgi:hypothetical protein